MSLWTLRRELPVDGLPAFLRRLAEALESGAEVPAGDADLPGFPGDAGGFALAVERCGAGWAMALRAAGREREAAAPGGDSVDLQPGRSGDARGADSFERAREKYRQLKKLMQEDYKTLRRAAQDGRTPPPETLESFLALCEAMADTAQPLLSARGTEATDLARANQTFLDDARTLRAAAHDPGALADVLGRLERRRAACHAQFR